MPVFHPHTYNLSDKALHILQINCYKEQKGKQDLKFYVEIYGSFKKTES